MANSRVSTGFRPKMGKKSTFKRKKPSRKKGKVKTSYSLSRGGIRL